MTSKKKKSLCTICNQRKGKRNCPRENIILICSKCCGKIRNLPDCLKNCPHLIPLLKDHRLLPEKRRAYRSTAPGSIVLWFEHRDSSGRWNFFSPLVDIWKAGFKDCHGEHNLSTEEYSLYFSNSKNNLDLIEIPWFQALYLLKSGMRIRDALHLPYPRGFTRFKKMLPLLDDIQVSGSVYKCYQCNIEDLPEDIVEQIMDITHKDITSGIIGQEGEEMPFFVCLKCSEKIWTTKSTI